MKIGLVSSMIPHVRGGYRFVVDWLEPHLRRAGHDVDRIFIPDGTGDALLDMATFRMLDLAHSCDRIITFRPPAHALKHPRKVVWFIHHTRVFYDLWDSKYCPVPKTAYWEKFRTALHVADTVALKEAHGLFCNSKVVKERLKRFNGLSAEVIYPPIQNPESFRFEALGDEIVSVCRIEDHKRQLLMVEAMAKTKTQVRLRLFGATQNPLYVEKLRAAVKRRRLEDRIMIDAQWISEDEKRNILSVALASVYVPLDEDSYGYPTLEAAHAEKATITATDSGGTLEFVEDGVSGLVTPPDARALGDAFDRLYVDRTLARKLGRGANQRIRTLKIDWLTVVERLTA
jgi:glycosyltransferase involved in cell wall biosynthesis